MVVGELKKLLKDIPDDYQIVDIFYNQDMGCFCSYELEDTRIIENNRQLQDLYAYVSVSSEVKFPCLLLGS